ncbi:hypothetical protein PMG11_08221 [Penicillium brasilianum]|uniref:C6 transcription factor n=1 Tax=Penicillium brasilianum TaxID=104259 RepID=A0A0F7TS44_PENBI|nr:hypothetical protein PMG11_08221 [Penicillium brasilianum]
MRPRLPAQSNRFVLSTPSIPENDNNEDLEHEGYRLTFVESQQNVWWLQGKKAAKHRHAIFTDAERQSMSNEVINSVPYRDPTQALLDLERFESTLNATTPFSLFRGPFGVSKLSQAPEPEVPNHEFDVESLSCEEWLTGLDDLIRREDKEIGHISSLFDGPSDQENDGVELWDPSPDFTNSVLHTPDPGLSPNFFSNNTEAWNFLSHYKDRIIPLISPFGHGQNAPWLNLVMPCAVSTLGDVTMNGATTHARLTLLNAVLSTSAFHLGNHSAWCIEYWVSIGNTYLKRAQGHFLRCIEEAYTLPTKRSKYKEILMAILSLSTAYMIKGDSEKRLFCLIQAEKFICINGFKESTVSPKRRALHHCYAYMRIMAETTSIADDLSDNLGRTSISDEDPAYTDFRKCPNIAFSGNIMETEKDPRVAQRDLHLAIPGRWSLTLFPKMYGVAESFLMLMSQVIRLANERDRSIENGDEGMLNLKDFWVRAKTLERGIQHLLESCTSTHLSAHDNEGPSQAGDGRALAMYTALRIFFYRRIYDLDAALLQQEVDSVRDSLVRVRQDEAGYSEGNTATLIWPAFIAACEAVSLESQHFFWSWFDSCLTTTGLVNASLAKQIFETIWTKRRETGQYEKRCNWPDVLRAQRIRLMFT